MILLVWSPLHREQPPNLIFLFLPMLTIKSDNFMDPFGDLNAESPRLHLLCSGSNIPRHSLAAASENIARRDGLRCMVDTYWPVQIGNAQKHVGYSIWRHNLTRYFLICNIHLLHHQKESFPSSEFVFQYSKY